MVGHQDTLDVGGVPESVRATNGARFQRLPFNSLTTVWFGTRRRGGRRGGGWVRGNLTTALIWPGRTRGGV